MPMLNCNNFCLSGGSFFFFFNAQLYSICYGDSRRINKCTKWSLYKSVVPFMALRNILALFQSLLSDTVLANQGKCTPYAKA